MCSVRRVRSAAQLTVSALIVLFTGCQPRDTPKPLEPVASLESADPALVAHTQEFERRIYQVTDGVHQAVGYGLANSILVEGDECVFVVDVLGTVEAAKKVRAEFEEITKKPIAALIYTHNHADHVFGARGFVPEGDVDVYAHETTAYYINRVASILRPILSKRSGRMFGNAMPKSGDDRVVNAGIGAALEIGGHGGGHLSLILPNKTFSDRLETTLCGVQVELVHAPGETNDQLFVWLPEKRVLMPGDNVYKAFPNLYTIRGTLYRDVLGWTRSLDAMRARKPAHLAPSHTRPVSGETEVMELLTAYRDAIQYVHDQTIRNMNRGLTPDELVEVVKLPPHLAEHPYLQEFYGTVEWSVRSVFAGYLGWFDGDGATLEPASPGARAQGYVDLAGGAEALRTAARTAIDDGRFAWAAELASHLLQVNPEDRDARALKAQALRALGQRSRSPNGRNYLITQALELEGTADVQASKIDETVLDVVSAIPIRNFIEAMPIALDPEDSRDVDLVGAFRFPDVDESYGLHIRRGVAEFQPVPSQEANFTIVADSTVMRDIFLQQRNFLAALAKGDVRLKGSKVDAVRFLRLFKPM